MKIFISYSSCQRDLVRRLATSLRAEGHSVYHDYDRIEELRPVHKQLRDAVRKSDLLIFLVSPASIVDSFALNELEIAELQWPSPSGRVLPVLAELTPVDKIPPYLAAVPVVEPRGKLIADVSARVERIANRRRRGRWQILGGVASATATLSVATMLFRRCPDGEKPGGSITDPAPELLGSSSNGLTPGGGYEQSGTDSPPLGETEDGASDHPSANLGSSVNTTSTSGANMDVPPSLGGTLAGGDRDARRRRYICRYYIDQFAGPIRGYREFFSSKRKVAKVQCVKVCNDSSQIYDCELD